MESPVRYKKYRDFPRETPRNTLKTANSSTGSGIFLRVSANAPNPVKYTDPDGKTTFILQFPWALPVPAIPIPWSGVIPWIGTILPPIIVTPLPYEENKLNKPQENPSIFDDHDIDMGNSGTWPMPPGDGPFTEGNPSLNKPKNRGEKSLFDKEGGEWRPQKPDKYHPNWHWNYKPPSTPKDKYPAWKNIDADGREIPKSQPHVVPPKTEPMT
jgi:hypothetical protein